MRLSIWLVSKNGQSRKLATPTSSTSVAMRNAGTTPITSARPPQSTAPMAWAPKRNIWKTDRPRARIQAGRKSSRREFTTESTTIHAAPAGRSKSNAATVLGTVTSSVRASPYTAPEAATST